MFMWHESLTIMTTVIGRFELVCLQNNSQVLIHWVSSYVHAICVTGPL